MGKRKERRIAAKSAANRRVKLDLFAEPSGEMMCTSTHDEVGGDPDQDHHAGIPSSPSSSGQRPENPLLLLGQYSDDDDDDDLDEETSKRAKHDADGNSPVDDQRQETTEGNESLGGDTEKGIMDGENKLEPDQVDTVEKLDHNREENESTHPTSIEKCEADPETHVSISGPSGVIIDGDLTGGWKMVMHEESNQYYYWNTVTGETSWEVPTLLSGGQAVPPANEGVGSHVDLGMATHLSAEATAYAYAAADELGSSNLVSKDPGEYSIVLGINNDNGEVLQLAYDGNQSSSHYSTAVPGIQYGDPSATSNFDSSLQMHGVTGISIAACHVSNHVAKDEHLSKSSESNEKLDVHSAHLVDYGESLLQRLETLNRSGNWLEGHELVKKEIEVRLSDCRALSSYGPSLLPFWWHNEAQLKQLEYIISNQEVHLFVNSKHADNLEVAQNSALKDEHPLQSIDAGSEAIERDRHVSSTSPYAAKVQVDATVQSLESDDVTGAHSTFGVEQQPESTVEANSSAACVNLVSRVESHADDMDMDMDVEMEVDEDVPTSDMVNAECSFPSEQLDHSNEALADCPPLPSDEPNIPPPPDEEWIPPPPPDNELVPPPPSEEPPVPSFPVPYPDTIPYASYSVQYSTGYTVPVMEYYTPPVGDVVNGSYYAQAEGIHVTESQPPVYYEPVIASSLPEVVVDHSSDEAVVYYDASTVSIPSGPGVSNVESSAYVIESGSIYYHENVPALDHTGSAEIVVDPGSSSLSERNIEVLTSVTGPQASNIQAASVSSNAQYVGVSSSNGSSMDKLPIVASKNQTKVVRRKKQTIAVAPTLRSNKKVSSLVDKWKAAKEELHGNEEPENAYEALEKKRQKEIEDWRAQQIASGEAQDNANFLPLGGDWRERVKRKKAAAAKKKAVQTHAEVDIEEKKPDLVELSKDLPSGWQAYWDETTKEIYYGNNITTETTWIRPKP